MQTVFALSHFSKHFVPGEDDDRCGVQGEGQMFESEAGADSWARPGSSAAWNEDHPDGYEVNDLHHGLGSEAYAQQSEESLELGSESEPEQEQKPEPELEPDLECGPVAESEELRVLAGVVVGQGNATEDAPENLMLRDITSSLAFWVANDPVTQQSRLCGLPECDRAELNLLLRMLADKLGLDMGLTYQWLEGSQLELVECPECGCRKRVCARGLCRGCCSRLVCECWVQQEDSEEDDQVKVVEHFSKVSWGVPTGLATYSGGVALRDIWQGD